MEEMHLYCPLCEKETMGDFVSRYKNKNQLFANRNLYQCRECSLIFVHPMPSSKDLDTYYKTIWTTSDAAVFGYQIQAEERVHYLKRYLNLPQNAKILDVGSGHGLLYDAFRNNGFSSVSFYATDPSPENMERLKKRGVNAFLEIREISEKNFDLVSICSVLEHVPDPVVFLSSIIGYVRQGGYIFIDLPERDDTFKPVLEPHVTVYTIESLSNLINKTGLDIVNITGYGVERSKIIEELHKTRGLWDIAQSVLFIIRSKSEKLLFKTAFYEKERHRLYQYYKIGEEGRDRWWIRTIARKPVS